MRKISLAVLATLIAAAAISTSRERPSASLASPEGAPESIVQRGPEDVAPVPPRAVETPRSTETRPPAGRPEARPSVPAAAFEPMQQLEREVGLEDWQREPLATLLAERQGALRQAFSAALRDGKGETGACAAVKALFVEYEPRVLAQLSAIQQAKYIEGRRAGSIGRPMLVYTYDEEF